MFAKKLTKAGIRKSIKTHETKQKITNNGRNLCIFVTLACRLGMMFVKIAGLRKCIFAVYRGKCIYLEADFQKAARQRQKNIPEPQLRLRDG